MSPQADLEQFTALLSDGAEIDWEEAESALTAEQLEDLRVVERIARFHSREETPTGPRLGKWGHLELRERIGKGSFGEVYRAWDPTLEREVALKVLRPGKGPAGQPKTSILKEGRLLARIRHENVATVHGVAEHEGEVGLWMEFAVGRTLAEIVAKEGPFGSLEAAAIGIELCRALAAVHASGLVHRDVKAENVIREKGGRIVLVDFGLGSRRDRQWDDSKRIVGTPLYLAPEIVLGKSSHSAQSDLYALGVLLYYLATGTFPIQARNLSDLTEAHRRRRYRHLLDARADLRGDFTAVVEKALNPDRSQRFASAGQFEQALAAIGSPLVSTGGEIEPPTRSRRRVPILILGASLLLVLLVFAVPPRWAAELGVGSLREWIAGAPIGPAASDLVDSEAYRLYLRGRHHWNKRTPEEIRKAIAFFEKARQEDPELALAYSGLADSYSTLIDYGVMDVSYGANAVGLAMRSLELDDSRAETHASVGLAESLFRHRWKEAEVSFKRAIELDQEYAPAYQWYAALLTKVGRVDEAVATILIGLKHDDLSASLHTITGWMMLFARDYDRAMEQAATALDLDPHYYYAEVLKARLLALRGDFEGARRTARSDLVRNTASPVTETLLASIEAGAGNRKAALDLIAPLEARRGKEHFAATQLAAVYALLGLNDHAFEWLETAYREGDSSILFLKVYPYYDNLRADPRYEEMLRRLNLDEASLAGSGG